MFNIYLTNWVDEVEEEVQDGHNEPELQTNYYLIDEETLIMSVPFSEGEEPCMINPTIKSEMGKAESLDFTINPGMKYYNSYQELKTLIRVEYKESLESEDAETIFFGRVVTINTSNLLAIKSIHAEGAYSVLQDTPIEGLEEELQPKIGQWALFGNIIGEHNDWIGDDNDDSWKQMRVVGLNSIESPISFKDEPDKKCAPTSWNTSMAAIDDLIGNNGGYMKVRYDPTSFPYLKIEWHRKYFRDYGDPIAHPNCERPSFELAKNIIDLSSTDEISELFTRVIPIGHKASTKKNSKETSFIYVSGKYISVKSIRPSDNWLEDNFQSLDEFVHAEDYYGIIYKTVNFPNADTVAKLEEYATDWIKRNYFGALRSFTVKAIDMKMVNMDKVQNSLILSGDCVDISYPYFDKDGKRHMTTETRLVCKSAQIVLFNPEQNVYTIGVPNDAVDFEYGERKKPKKAGSSTIAGSTSAPPPSNSTVYDLDFDAAYSYLRWFYYANDWGDIATAQSYCAYSWRCGGLTSWTDQAPADSFRANGLPKHEFVEIVDKPIYDPAYPGDPDHIIGYEPTSTEIFDYYYVKIAGLSNVRLMGHYTMSKVPNGLEPGVTPPGYNITNGYTYGFGYVEGTDDAVAFSWNEYASGKGNPEDSNSAAIEALFHFPNLFGNHSLGSLSNPDTGANTGITDEEGNPGWVNSDGEVMVEIFPELGTVGAGYAYEFNEDGTIKIDPATGEPVVLKDQDGHPVWAISLNDPITYYDEQGNPHTIPSGVMVANDLSLPNIPSFKTEMAAIHTLIAANATIAQLRATIADIGNYDDVSDADFATLFETDYHYTDSGGNVVLPFSTKKSYQTGDRVGYNNKIYQFISNHSPGAWNSSQVTLIGDGTKVDNVDADGNKILKVKEGTRFANTNDQIQGVAGRFILNQNGSMDIIEGAGINLRRVDGGHEASFGIWDDGRVDAGMICEKINGEASTKILGKSIKIGTKGYEDITLGDAYNYSDGFINVEYPMSINKDLVVVNDYSGAEPVKIMGDLEVNGTIWSDYNYTVETSDGPKSYNILDIESLENNTKLKITKVNPDTGEIEIINFNKAASISSFWSSDKFPLIMCAHPSGTNINGPNDELVSSTYKVGFSGDPNILLDIAEKIEQNESGTRTNYATVGTDGKTLYVPIAINEVELNESGEPSNPIERYSTTVSVNGVNAHNAGWNAAADKMSFSSEPLTDIQILDNNNYPNISITYPKKNDVGKTNTESYTLTVLDNIAYIDHDDDHIAKVKHNKYDNGWNAAAGKMTFTNELSSTQLADDKNYPNISIVYPKKNDVGKTSTESYTLTVLDNVAYIEGPSEGETEKRYAKVKHNRYNSGVNAGGATARLVNSDNVDAASSLSRGATYTIAYTNADGTLTKTSKVYSVPNSGTISIGDQHDTSSKQELQNMYGSTATLNTAFSSEQLNKNSRFYGFKVTCGTSSKYYYFKTPDSNASRLGSKDVTVNRDTTIKASNDSLDGYSQVRIFYSGNPYYGNSATFKRTGVSSFTLTSTLTYSKWRLNAEQEVHW